MDEVWSSSFSSTAEHLRRNCKLASNGKFRVQDTSPSSLRIRLSDIRKPYRTGCGSARVVPRDYPGATAPGSEYRRMRKSQWSRRFQVSLASLSFISLKVGLQTCSPH